MVGDVALASMPLPMLRRHVALVTQEHHIFIGTVHDNLALAKPEATDDEIVRALEAVDALEWVQSLPRASSQNSARPVTRSRRPRPNSWRWRAWS